ncbi:hypothetical protein [Brucella intermedia]|uniref:hypothetical protein n=1 Tax=Brucella intermedia TaxID=94625 RepID=UPI003140C380
MTVRTIDEIFRDFVTDGVPASGPFNPHKPDIRDTLKALTEGSENFPDNRVIRLNNADEGTANNIVVTASVAIPAAAYQVLYILNVTQENTGPVTVSGAISRALVTNINQPVPAGYLTPGMALLCIDTGSELRMLSYGDVEEVIETLVIRAEAAAEAAEAAAGNNWSSFDTVSSVQSANIPTPVNYLRTAGYYSAGDGGGALYKRVVSEPTHAGKIQSADGAWWELSTEYITPNMFGAKCDGINDDVPAINAAWAYATSLGLIGAPLHLVSNKVYYAGTSIQLGPIDSKQRVLEGNGALIKCLPTLTGYLFDSNNLAGVFAWRVELRNFTADGIYMSSDVNFVRLRHVNGLNLDNVYVQSFNIGMNLSDSYAVATRGVTFRYIRQHVFLLNTSSMQLKLIDTRAYGTNSGSGVTGAAAIRNVAANNNITLIGCDFESGKGPFFYTNAVVNQLSITNSYIEGFEVDPIYFDAAVNAFTFEGNWLGYNNGRQEWANIKSGRISGNVFAKQAFFVGVGNADVFEGNNVFIDQSTITPAEQRFSFRVTSATLASGATALDTPGYKRFPTGEVMLSGRLSRTASGDLFTLPDGYRPKVAATFITVVEGTFNRARVDITTSGLVSVTYESTAGALRLDGIVFLT